ncbi:MAG: hypothetical protein Aurels2KO_48050 [Aureliella sp.]
MNEGSWAVLPGDTRISGFLDGFGSVTLSQGSALILNPGQYDLIAQSFSGAGALVVESGTVRLTGSNTSSGGLFLNGGITQVYGGSRLGALDNTIHFDGGELQFLQSDNFRTENWNVRSDSVISAQNVEAHIYGKFTGSKQLEIKGGGKVFLKGDNSGFAGEFLVSDGQLVAGENNSLGAQTTVTVNEAATFRLQGNEDWGSIRGEGCVDIGEYDARVFTTGSDTLEGHLRGSGTFTMAGTGEVRLGNYAVTPSRFTGDLAVTKGRLELNGFSVGGFGGTITTSGDGVAEFNTRSANPLFDGTIVNNGRLLKTGSGTLTLQPTNTGSTGVVEVAQGTLRAIGRIPGETLDLSGGTFEAGSGIIVNNLRVTAGGSTLATGANDFHVKDSLAGNGIFAKTGSGTMSLSGADASSFTGKLDLKEGTLYLADMANASLAIQSTAKATVRNGTVNLGSLEGGGTLELLYVDDDAGPRSVRVGHNNVSTTFSGQVTGSGNFYKTGTGTLTLTGNNNGFDSLVHVEQGTLAVRNANSLGESTVLNDGATIKLTDSFALNGGPFKGITLDSPSATGTIDTNGHNLSDARIETGGGTIVKTGSGTLSLRAGSESLSGTYRVEGGVLAGSPGPGARLELVGSEFVALTSNLFLAEGVHLEGGGAYNVTAGASVRLLNASVTGSGTFAKKGSGLLNLAGDNSKFSGAYQVQSGTLEFGHVDSLNNNDIEIQSGATAEISIDQSYSGSLSGDGVLDLGRGTGGVTLSGNNAAFGGRIDVGRGRTLYAGRGNSLGDDTSLNIRSGGIVEIEDNEYWGGLTGNGTLALEGGHARLGQGNQSTSFNGTIRGSGDFAKTGSGDFTFNGDASGLAGDFTVMDGTLSGTGQFNQLMVEAGAALAIGNSPGIINIDDLVLESGSLLEIELGGLLAGTEYDQFRVNGDASIFGGLAVSLTDGFQLSFGQEFLIGDIGGNLTGQFAGLSEGGLVGKFGEHDLFVSYRSGSGNSIGLFTAVPEPSSALLIGLGTLLFTARRSRSC